MREEQADHQENVIYYQRGIGTGTFDRVPGGAIGLGLERNIRRSYRFLAQHYSHGDRIFIFGFSRGAYTARSLVGLVSTVGLLKSEFCTPNIEAATWDYYRRRPADRHSGIKTLIDRYTHPSSEMAISCLAIFDTVGALGIPLHGFWKFNREL